MLPVPFRSRAKTTRFEDLPAFEIPVYRLEGIARCVAVDETTGAFGFTPLGEMADRSAATVVVKIYHRIYYATGERATEAQRMAEEVLDGVRGDHLREPAEGEGKKKGKKRRGNRGGQKHKGLRKGDGGEEDEEDEERPVERLESVDE